MVKSVGGGSSKSVCFQIVAAFWFFLLLSTASVTLAAATADDAYTLESLIQQLQTRYRGTSAESFVLKARLLTQVDEDEDAKVGDAEIELSVSDGLKGLSIHYPSKLLSDLQEERKRFESNPDHVNSIRDASARMTVREVQSLTAAHLTLLRRLRTATMLSQKKVDYKGVSAYLLEFDVEPKFSNRDKKYIKKYQANLKLWLSVEGVPLAAKTDFSLKGRAFFVVRFRSEETEEVSYKEFGDRLVAVSRKRYNANSGGGEYGESTLWTTLKVPVQSTASQ